MFIVYTLPRTSSLGAEKFERPFSRELEHHEEGLRSSGTWVVGASQNEELTLPNTNLAPENRPSQKELHLPTIDLQGAFAVSFGEGWVPLKQVDSRQAPLIMDRPPGRGRGLQK